MTKARGQNRFIERAKIVSQLPVAQSTDYRRARIPVGALPATGPAAPVVLRAHP
jgi:hypothetical protein